MATVVNKLTLEVKYSVNTPDYMDGNWLINPVLPIFDKKFWKIVDDVIVEMTEEEKQELISIEIEKQREELYNSILRIYEEVELANFTPAGVVQLKEWCDDGVELAIANKKWLEDHYKERHIKLIQVELGNLSVVPEPSVLWKPYTFKEIMNSLS